MTADRPYHRRVSIVDMDRRPGLLAYALRRSRVVDVMMGDDDGADTLQRKTQIARRFRDLLPVSGVTGVDQNRFPALGDEVEVGPSGPEPEHPLGDLGRPGAGVTADAHRRQSRESRTAVVLHSSSVPGPLPKSSPGAVLGR